MPQSPEKNNRKDTSNPDFFFSSFSPFAQLNHDRIAQISRALAVTIGLVGLHNALPRDTSFTRNSAFISLAISILVCSEWYSGRLSRVFRSVARQLNGLMPSNVSSNSFYPSSQEESTERGKGSNTVPDFTGKCTQRTISLSAPECFLSKDAVCGMTLRDVADIFLYALQANRSDFNRDEFFRTYARRNAAKHAIHALDCATLWSRGPNTVLSQAQPDSYSDSIDALLFCAAGRIYGEWRTVRSCPSGYPTYKFGLDMARKDLIHNLAKIEKAVHRMMDDQHRQKAPSSEQKLASPTLRQLLQYEVNINLHRKLPVLAEQSAASGFLWTKRQIAYQNSTLDNNSRVPIDFPTPKAAFLAAYEAVYEKYHSFPNRTLVRASLDKVPPSHVVLRQMNIPYYQDSEAPGKCEDSAKPSGKCDNPEQKSGNRENLEKSSFKRGNLEQIPEKSDNQGELGRARTWTEQTEEELDSTMEADNSSDGSPVPQVGCFDDGIDHQIVVNKENCKNIFLGVFGPCVSNEEDDNNSHEDRNAMLDVPTDVLNQVQMEKNDVPHFLSVLRPMEKCWDDLIAELNMNDPSRA